MLEKTFGHNNPGIAYQDRIGAYGIGFDNQGRIPVTMTHLNNRQKAYFLLGGGVNQHESHEDCIKRECIEEAGLNVIPKELICKSDFYQILDETQTGFHGIGYFYYMELGEVIAKPTEPDHHIIWLTIDEIREKLFLPHQIWAVGQVYKLYGK